MGNFKETIKRMGKKKEKKVVANPYKAIRGAIYHSTMIEILSVIATPTDSTRKVKKIQELVRNAWTDCAIECYKYEVNTKGYSIRDV